MVPREGTKVNSLGLRARPLTQRARGGLGKQGVQGHYVNWTLPPGMKFKPMSPIWCGPKDLMRLHVFGLDPSKYAAVAYFDSETQVMRPEFTQLMRCAASGYFISTSGPLGPMNLGLMVIRPNKALLDAAVRFAQMVYFNGWEGWNKNGLAPVSRPYPGAECGQGFVWTFLYKSGASEVRMALSETGAVLPKAVMVDRCIWNHQQNWGCERKLNCSRVVMIHKDKASHCKQTVIH